MTSQQSIISVPQSEYRVSDQPDAVMMTILGSCIATCLWDPEARIGGMNHILLPGSGRESDGNFGYGVNLMELLVNGLHQRGANKQRLRAKVFGGAKMFDTSNKVGDKNAEFAKWFLENEGIPIVSICVGGNQGRKIRFSPTTGAAQRKFLKDVWNEPAPPVMKPAPVAPPAEDSITLF